MGAITVEPSTDLAQFIGRRVRITRDNARVGAPGMGRSTFFGVFTELRHPADRKNLVHPALADGCGGMLLEESHGTCKGGHTGFHLPYGDATLELVPAEVTF